MLTTTFTKDRNVGNRYPPIPLHYQRELNVSLTVSLTHNLILILNLTLTLKDLKEIKLLMF